MNASPPSTTAAWNSSPAGWACSGPTWNAHHPGIDSLHLPADVADGWKQRLRTKPKTITTADGGKTVIDVERICYREFLTPVRAFYLDLAQWAVDDPARWGPWVAPCPVGPAETIQGKVQRHRKSRMDARTRERLPSCRCWPAPPPSTAATPRPCCTPPARPAPAPPSPPPGRP